MDNATKNLLLEQYTEIMSDADDLETHGFPRKASELKLKAEGMEIALEILGFAIKEVWSDRLNGFEYCLEEIQT